MVSLKELKSFIGKKVLDFAVINGNDNFSVVFDDHSVLKFKDEPFEVGYVEEIEKNKKEKEDPKKMEVEGESPFEWRYSMNKKLRGTVYKVYNKFGVWFLRIWFILSWIAISIGIILLLKHWDKIAEFFGII